jgi:hypothetical protein
MVLNDERIRAVLGGKAVRRVIVARGNKLINIVVENERKG